MAEASAARWRGKPGAHYANQPRTHFIGRLGEIAYWRWLTGQSVECQAWFLDEWQEARCDIETWEPRVRIEVKTWTVSFWRDLGRCVAAGQLAGVQRKADIIAWAVVRLPVEDWQQAQTADVTLAGWSSVAEVAASAPRPTGRPGKRQILNHQLEISQLRPVNTLAALLAGVAV